MTARDGRIVRLDNVFLRGAQIKFIVLPELLKSASVLKKIQGMKAKREETEGGGKASSSAASKKSKHVRF
jgi:small nuclear ribonucleoprotein D3